MEGRRSVSGAGLALLPLASLVKRELVRNLRRTRPFVWLALTTMVAALIVIFMYPDEKTTPMMLRSVASILFSNFTTMLTLIALVLVPAYGAATIVVEREQDTFDLLSLTLLRPPMTFIGKLASVLGLFVLIECAMLPIVASAFFLIGVDVLLMAQTAVGLLVIAMTGACAGILSSTYVRGTPQAISGGYVLTMILLIGYAAPFGLLAYMIWTQSEWAGQYAYALVGFLVNLSPFALLGSVRRLDQVVMVILAQGFFWVACLLAAWKLLRRTPEERSYSTAAVSARSSPALRNPTPALSESPPLPSEITAETFTDPRPRAVRGPRAFGELPPWPSVPDGANPLFRRELRQFRVTQRLTPLRAVVGGVFVLSAMMLSAYIVQEVWMDDRAANLAVRAWMLGLVVFMAFVTPAVSATTWTREYERETADLLRMSLLTPYEMLLGKLTAALVACASPLLIALLASWPLLILLVAGPTSIVAFAAGVVTIVVTMVECVAVSMWLGMMTRKTTAAILYGYAGVFVVLFNSILFGLLNAVSSDMLSTFALLPRVSSPVYAFGSFVFRIGSPISDGATWIVAMGLHLGVAVFVLQAARRLLIRRHMVER